MSPGLFVPAYMKHAAFPQLPTAKAVLSNSYTLVVCDSVSA